MWIQSTREAHAGNRFKDQRVHELNDGDPVSFSDNGTAQVSAEVGEYLTTEYDVFVERDDGDDDGEADESSADTVDADDDDTTGETDY